MDAADSPSPADSPTQTIDPLIVLFDGECGLCDRLVRFILHHDKDRRFRFAPQQSQVAMDLLKAHHLDPQTLDSVVLIDGDRAYVRSTAVLRITMELPDPWPLASLAVFIPQSLRDLAYDWIARHRKQWFKPTQCPMPTPQDRDAFLGSEA